MTEPALLIRIALLGGLAAVLGVEVFAAPGPATPPRPAPAARAGTARPAPSPLRAGEIDKAVSTVLVRPLFRVDRRPPLLPSEAPAAAGRAADLPRLSGIVISAAGGTAIFEGGSKPVVARVGDRLGAFTVAAITAGSVTLDGPQGAQVLVPRFDASLARTAAAAPPSQQFVTAVPGPPPNLNELINRRRTMHGQPSQ
jgi:hypothetical protein